MENAFQYNFNYDYLDNWIKVDRAVCSAIKENTEGKDTLWNFSFKAFHETQFQSHFMKYEILSWNTVTSVSKIHRVMFLINKKIVKDTVKRSQRKGIVSNLIKKISCKKFKTSKTYLNETTFENQGRQKYKC